MSTGVVHKRSDAAHRRRLAFFAATVVLAIALAAVVIATSGNSNNQSGPAQSSAGTPSSDLAGAAAVAREFRGIPQRGNTLGNPAAKATMMVFADPQCPFCAEFENKALPALVSRYVRAGKLKIVFQPLVVVGDQSMLGVRAMASAAQQDKMFSFNALLYRNQGQENSGYLSEGFVRSIARAIPGVDEGKLMSELESSAVNKLLTDAQNTATAGHVSSVPSFFMARGSRPLERFDVSSLAPEAFYGKLDTLTR